MGNQSGPLSNYIDLNDLEISVLDSDEDSLPLNSTEPSSENLSNEDLLVDSLFGFPYVESPEDDILMIGSEFLSPSFFNVSPDLPPLGDCPPPLSLADEVSDSIINISFFNSHPMGVKKSFIEYLSEQNNGFEQIQKGEFTKAREILVEKMGVSDDNFELVTQKIQSRSSSPSDKENQSNYSLQS